MRAIIVSGGTKPSKELLLSYIKEGDYIIGVDKGCNCLYEYNIKPNLILGDFDSAKKEVVDYFYKNNVKTLRYNSDKDYTDTDLGYIKAKEAGATEIIFFAVTGSRIDHMLANVGVLLKALKENIKAKIVDDNNEIFLIKEKAIFKGESGSTISFHALSDEVTNLHINGARYELHDYNMTLLEPRAICNEFIDKDIEVSFDKGIIMVIYPNE